MAAVLADAAVAARLWPASPRLRIWRGSALSTTPRARRPPGRRCRWVRLRMRDSAFGCGAIFKSSDMSSAGGRYPRRPLVLAHSFMANCDQRGCVPRRANALVV